MVLLIYVSKQSENGQFPICRCTGLDTRFSSSGLREDKRRLIKIGACPTLDESQVICGIAMAVGLRDDETITFTEDCGTHLIYRVSRKKIADA